MHTTVADRRRSKTKNKQDFWLVYSSAETTALADAIHALYYLPESYKLMVLGNISNAIMLDAAHDEIIKRIHFESDAGPSNQTTPFSFEEHVVIYPTSRKESASTKSISMIIVAQSAGSNLDLHEWNGFTVSAGKPEALASAALKIARSIV